MGLVPWLMVVFTEVDVSADVVAKDGPTRKGENVTSVIKIEAEVPPSFVVEGKSLNGDKVVDGVGRTEIRVSPGGLVTDRLVELELVMMFVKLKFQLDLEFRPEIRATMLVPPLVLITVVGGNGCSQISRVYLIGLGYTYTLGSMTRVVKKRALKLILCGLMELDWTIMKLLQAQSLNVLFLA